MTLQNCSDGRLRNTNLIADGFLRPSACGQVRDKSFRVHGAIISNLMPEVKQVSDLFSDQNPCMTTFGERLRASRKDAGLSQQQAAKMAGVSQGLISDLENNVYQTSAMTITLATIYQVNARWLADGVGDKNNVPLSDEEKELLASYRMLPQDQRSRYRMHITMEADILRSAPSPTKPNAGRRSAG